MSAPRRVAVLGAGITGLSAAWEVLKRGGAEVTVFEVSPRVGGKILTEESNGSLFEAGPDSFVTMRPHAVELVRELDLGPDLLDFEMASGGVGVFWGGRLRFLPAGMSLGVPTRVWPLATCDLLSWRGKLRAALEPWVPPNDGDQDESLAEFLRRRLGPEVLERVAGPMLAGIYAADPEKLSLLATFPQLRDMERRGGAGARHVGSQREREFLFRRNEVLHPAPRIGEPHGGLVRAAGFSNQGRSGRGAPPKPGRDLAGRRGRADSGSRRGHLRPSRVGPGRAGRSE